MAKDAVIIVEIIQPPWARALVEGMTRLRKIGIPIDAKLVAETIAEACKYKVVGERRG